MPSIDERIVSMVFENAKFEAGVAQTMQTLGKLDESLKQVGKSNSLGDIEKEASKVTLEQPMSALEKLKSKLGFGSETKSFDDLEAASAKVTMDAPVSALDRLKKMLGSVGDGKEITDIEANADKVTLDTPVKALDRLKEGLGSVGDSKEFADIQNAAERVNFQRLVDGVDNVSQKFSVMGAMAFTAIQNVTNGIINFTKRTAHKLMDPILGGGMSRALKLEQARFQFKGLGQDVEKSMESALAAVKGTAYGLDAAASVASQFGATGMTAGDEMTGALRGVAGMAAMTGRSYEEIGDIFTTIAGEGKLSTMRMQQFASRGVNVAAQLSKATGKSEVEIREMVKSGDISFRDFAKYMNQAFGEHATKANETYTGSLANMRAALSRLGASIQVPRLEGMRKVFNTLTTVIDNFHELLKPALELWAKFADSASNKTVKFLEKIAKALDDMRALGSAEQLARGLKAAFDALLSVLKPVLQAFRDIFPNIGKSGDDMEALTSRFMDFMEGLKPSANLIDGLRRTFRGLFALLDIGVAIVKGIVGSIFELLGIVGKGSGGFLQFTGSIGDFLVAVDNALVKSGALKVFFEKFSSILHKPVKMLFELGGAILGLFSGLDTSGATKLGNSLDGVRSAAGPLGKVLDTLKTAWDGFVHILGQAKDLVSPWLDEIGHQLSNLGNIIAEAFSGANFDHIMTALQTTFIGGIFLVLKKAITGGATDLGSALGGVNKVFGALTANLQAMQEKVKAQTLFLIASAIGVLAAATFVLSTIEPKRLASALTAMAVGFGQLMGAMKLITSGLGIRSIATMPLISASLIAMAGAMIILGLAMKIFATMSWEGIAKGLVGVGGGIAVIGDGMKALGPRMLNPVQIAGLIGMGVALNLLAVAVKQFSGLSWEELATGLAGVLGVLTAIIAPITAAGPGFGAAALGVIGIAFAMSMLAAAVRTFGETDPQTLVVGITSMSIALAGLSAAAWLLPPGPMLIAQAVGLTILAVALAGIATAVGIMGSLGIPTLVKGLISLSLALDILAVGLYSMSGTQSGSVALLAAAAALALLAPTLGFMGALKWTTILKGLITMAAALAVLAIAGLYAAPGISALGMALLPLAGVLVLTAGAVFLFAKGLALLGDKGAQGIGVAVAALTAFIAILPKIVIDFVKGLVEIIAEMAKLTPMVLDALTKMLDKIIAWVAENAPKLAIAIGVLIDSALVVLGENTPKLVAAGAKMMLDILGGIAKNIPQVVSKAAEIVVKFLAGIASKIGAITAAGANLIVKYLAGISSQFPKLVGAAIDTVLKFIGAVAGQLPKVLTAGIKLLANFITGIFSRVGEVIDAGVRVVLNIVTGIGKALPKIVKAAGDVIIKFVNAVADVGPKVVDAGYKALIKFLHGIAQAIRENNKDLVNAGVDIAQAIVEGVVDGLGIIGRRMIKPVVEKLFGMLPGWARKILGIHSPSTVFAEIGENIGKGLLVGLGSMESVLRQGITDPIQAMLRANKDVRAFGKFLGSEFRDGLTGGLWGDNKSQSQKTIEGAFAGLKGKLGEEQKKLRDAIKQDQAQLKEELGKDPQNRDQKLIAKLSANIATNRNLLNEATNATRRLLNNLQGTKEDLLALGKSYEDVSKKLEAAKAALDEARQARDEAVNSYTSQYSQTPDIDSLVSEKLADEQMSYAERIDKMKKDREEADKRRNIDQVALYKQALQEQIVATQRYNATLQKLRELGLDDTTYKKLLEQGTKGQQFADQLLASGKGGIEQLNKLDAEVLAKSTQLAQDAAKNLYQAGIDAAKGLVKGLQARQSEIRKTMESIASEMVNALKKKLKIKSPSQVFMEVGKFSAEGFVLGFENSTSNVASAAEGVGDSALSAIQNSMRKVSDIVTREIDPDLTITPVLDLSNVRKGAKELGDLTNVTPITAAASYGQASAISTDVAASQRAQADAVAAKEVSLEFNQTITSPKAIDEVEVYRQTKNQLSQVKSALGLVS